MYPYVGSHNGIIRSNSPRWRQTPAVGSCAQGTNAYTHCAACDLDFCSTCCMSPCPMPLVGLNLELLGGT